MKKEEIVEILDKHLKTLIEGKEDEWFKFEEMKTMPEYNAVLNAMLEVAEKAVNKNCNLQNVTTRFSDNEIENVMRKVKKAKISPYLEQILQRATGDSYDSADDKAFLDKYTGKVANVYEWAGDWWIAEDDNYVITEDCFTIL